jgi:hypothetical protein
MMGNTGYWIDLDSVTFADEGVTWIQALPIGSYKHPLYGSINVTPTRVQAFAQNVKDGVRGTEIDIDYDHKAHSGKAAGWIRDAESRPDGLWVAVEWTEPAKEAIKNGEYRYFSPEFADVWTHPKTNTQFKDVLFGGGITNRPFLKDILPINMSELPEGEQVDEFLAELRTRLGLPEDATEEQILEAAKVPEPPKQENEPPTPEQEPEPVLASDELKKLAETNPAIKTLMEFVVSQKEALDEQGKTITELQATNSLSEARIQLGEWQRGGSKGKWALPPATADAVTKCLSEFPTPARQEFVNFVDAILSTGLVSLREEGRTNRSEMKSAHDDFETRAAKLMEANEGMTYADAVVAVAAEDPELADRYRSDYLSENSPEEV